MQRVRVVAKWEKRSLLTTEIISSNPVINKIYIEHLFTVNCIENTKIKKKEAGNGPFKKMNWHNLFLHRKSLHKCFWLAAQKQCDQMATLNCQLYRLFTTFEFRKISFKICLGWFKILTNTKYNIKKNWPNFAKNGKCGHRC